MSTNRYKTAMAFIGDFATLDVQTMLSRRTDDCTHTFLPASIALPPKGNAAFREHIGRLRGIMPTFPVSPEQVMEDEQQNMVVVHATSEAHFHEELKDYDTPAEEWMYRGEYIFIFTMNESGDKVRRVVEFVDSKGTERLMGLIRRARANKERADARNA